MRAPTLKIEHARYVVTLDGARRIIQDGSILVEGARISRVGKAAELADAPADRDDRRPPPPGDPRVRQRPHAHQLRPRRARHLPGRHGQPAALRLPAPDGDDGGGGVPHDPARPRGAPQGRHRRLRRSRQHQVPRRLSPGVRGRGHPRDPRRVRGGPGGPVPAAALRHRRGDRPHGVLHPEVGRPPRRADAGVGDAVLAGDLQRRPPGRAQAPGRRARDRAHAPPRKRRRGAAGVPRAVRASPDRVSRVERGARPERAPVPRAGPRRRRDRVPRADRHRGGDVPGHRRQGGEGDRRRGPDAGAAPAGRAGRARRRTRPTTRTISTWCGP